ncbi:MAG: hypothetical protein FJ148_24145 [Deltaproteobacteria bacterium]|nr:hypothetical protein [Deltaproteobacteria bacterium]
MEAVIDASSLISFARAGLLDLLRRVPFDLVLLAEVRAEAVTSGLVSGHADAAAIEAATRPLSVRASKAGSRRPVDAVVVEAATAAGLLIANDLALGRRARNLGAQWLRSADVVVLLADLGRIDRLLARAAVVALRDASRITPELAAAYLDRLGGEHE